MAEVPERLRIALSDRYRLERELGAGGMATVYLADDLRHQRKVAVKVLRPELSLSIGEDRFLREVATAASLQHPHILPLHDSGKLDGFLFYVMPFVDGSSLRQELARHGELPIQVAVRILRDVADAMGYAHERGVVHRDIKPENVMLSGRHALVTDFGIAKAVGEAARGHDVTSVGIALGTPAYMSPEQATADPRTDHRADIYAFGVLAYELLTGGTPFVGTSPQEIIASKLTDSPGPISQRRASVPPLLAAVVMQCLAKKPADRIQSAQQIVTLLETLLTPSGGTTPTVAGMLPVLRRSPLWRFRYPIAGAVTLAVAVLTLSRAGQTEPSIVHARPVQITFDGRIEVADLSPDGQLLAYVSSQSDKRALWVQDLGGGAPLRIASIGIHSAKVRWSPDGTSLALSGSDSTGARRTVVYPRLGGIARRELPDLYGYVAWSADGNRLAIWHTATNITGALKVVDLASGSHDTISISDPLSFNYEGDWSPSARLVFAGSSHGPSKRWTLKLLSMPDEKVRTILEDTVPLGSPRWVTRTGELYYVRDGDLWTLQVAADGSGRQPRLLRPGLDAQYASVSSRGNKLAYVRVSGHQNLWVVPALSERPVKWGNPVRLTRGTNCYAGSPSPDGSIIAYHECSMRWRSGGDLFVVPSSGGTPVQLTSGREVQSWPAWSPAGDALAYIVKVNGINRVRILQLHDKRERTFEATEVGDSPPAWAPGERIIYHRRGNRNFYLLDPQTGAEEPLVRNDSIGWMFRPVYSPDGESVAINWNRRGPTGLDPGLWVISLADGSQKLLLLSAVTPKVFPIGWSRDGRFVYTTDFAFRDPPGYIAVSADGSQKFRPLDTPAGRDYSFCEPFRSGEGSAFLCEKGETSSDVWMLEAPRRD